MPIPLRLARIATQARAYPDMAFTTLAHHLDVAMLECAVRRLTPHSAPGVDRVTWRTYQEPLETNLKTLHEKLVNDTYCPQPVVRRLIPKRNGKRRPWGLPALEDKIVAKAVAMLREAIYEQDCCDASYGLRPGRSPHQALHDVRQGLLGTRMRQVSDGDISAFFDTVPHDWLVAHIPMDQAMLRKWLNAGFMDKHIRYPTEAGVPQGGVASPVMMNLALNGLERQITDAFPQSQGGMRTKIHVITCAADFIITGRSKAFLEEEVQPLVAQFLAVRGLELSREKTQVTPIEEGCDFLGTHVRKYHGKLLCTPAKKNVQACLDTIRGMVEGNQQARTGNLIMQLNPVIRGWAQYHQHGASTRTFARVDHEIFSLLWQWARRRHPQTSRHWLRDTYFRTEGENNWGFCGQVMGSTGKRHDGCLFRASRVPIRRHATSKGAAHPYDPQWEPYFEARQGIRMAHNLKGRRYLLRLWKEQDGRCVICHQRITQLTGWHSHHLVWRTHGGSDRAENRVLLHPNCHAQVHSQGLTVVKPRPQTGVGKA